MKLIFAILIMIILTSCVDTVNPEDRPSFTYSFNELKYIDISGEVEITTFPYTGNFEVTKDKITNTIIRDDGDSRTNELKIRTAYWGKDKQKLEYRTDRGKVTVNYKNHEIVSITMSSGNQIITFSKK